MKQAEFTSEEKLTINTYDQFAEEWANEHSDTSYWKKEFETFVRILPQGKILEIGCGAGRDAKVLISKGYDYTGIDVSEKLVNVAKKLAPKGKFLVENLYNTTFQDNYFDGFWASAVLLHIPKDKVDAVLLELQRVVKTNGTGFISIKEGQGEKVVEEEFTKGIKASRFWAFYTQSEFNDVLERNNYEIVKSSKWSKSPRTTWLIYFVRVKK